MTNEDIFQKAIEKARANGWDNADEKPVFHGLMIPDGEQGQRFEGYEGVIFSHDFAKAFWAGNSLHPEKYEDCKCRWGLASWQYHLQQLALAKDRFAYLAKFIN